MGKKVEKTESVAVRHQNILKKSYSNKDFFLPRAGHQRNAARAGIKIKSNETMLAADKYAKKLMEDIMDKITILVESRKGRKVVCSDVAFAVESLGNMPWHVYGN